ncbi:MAG: acetylxylan esterase [Gammaproteobacteria bacterium]|nr:acetylxylan esterase [Gammaproteobacteria bacterium]
MLILLDINQQEEQVPAYELPSLLRSVSGEPIRSAEQWRTNREGLLAQFAEHIYGQTPGKLFPVNSRVIETGNLALNGKATRQQVELDFQGHKVTVLIYRPNDVPGSVPAFLGLNFRGNHTISDDPAVLLTESWVSRDEDHGVLSHRATDANRGQRVRRYPLEMIIDRGYALVTAYYGDFYPDHRDGLVNSVHGLFNHDADVAEWGAIGAWSWGMSRMLDYLEQDEGIDASRVIAIGHSRLGKASLWAAAQDQRFAAAISNNSGAVGAALSRRQFGETVKIITAMFPHWFTTYFENYAGQEDELPVDQHQLIALLAPRPVYVASASKDHWADPRGEFLAAGAATQVYRLFGMDTNKFLAMPAAGEALTGPVSYHLRDGKHDLLDFDWRHYLNFADCYLAEKASCQ